jgi:DNA-binding CsgD family transcriptional regulator
MSAGHTDHARTFERLANAPLQLATLPNQLLEALARVVPFDAYCWGAVDPISLLPTRATGTTIQAGSHQLWEVQELFARHLEPRDASSVARSGHSVAVLSETVEKDQSPYYQRILRPNGLEHQLRAALVVDDSHWGMLNIERRADRPDFSPGEVTLVDALVPHLAHAFRRWLLTEPNHPHSPTRSSLPGVIVLDEDNEIDSISPEAEHWLNEWGLSELTTPPGAIAAVVAAARARADGFFDSAPSARLRLPSGAWLHARATHLTRPDGMTRTAIVLERASPEQVAPMVARAHQLSERETQIALLVLRGLNTNEIAAHLFISPYTVQDHLKSIVEKVGVRSRRELATEIFEPHYQAA